MPTTPVDAVTARGFPPVAFDERRACRAVDTNVFYPRDHRGGGPAWDRDAKAICRPCPVRAACLAWALDTEQEHGVWGGFNGRERRHARQRMHRDDQTAEQVAALVIAYPYLVGGDL